LHFKEIVDFHFDNIEVVANSLDLISNFK